MLLIYVPTSNEEEAKKIGRTLIKEKLAVCVNIIPRVTSIFYWENEIQETEESLLLLKTNESYNTVRKRIEELHSYDVPLVACFKLDDLNEKYKKWANSLTD